VLIFHSLGNHAKVEAVAEVDDRADDRCRMLIGGDSAYERAVDLDFMNW
jgi:hypothetical protein